MGERERDTLAVLLCLRGLGNVLVRLERYADAARVFQRAAELTSNTCERELLLARARACTPSVS